VAVCAIDDEEVRPTGMQKPFSPSFAVHAKPVLQAAEPRDTEHDGRHALRTQPRPEEQSALALQFE